jgi:MFS family permease
MALSGLAFAATPLVRQLWPLLGVSALMGASLGFTQPLSMSLLAESVAAEFWGAAFGIRQSVQRAAGVVSPFAFGIASAARGIESAFYFGAMVLFAAAGVMTKVAARWHAGGPSAMIDAENREGAAHATSAEERR